MPEVVECNGANVWSGGDAFSIGTVGHLREATDSREHLCKTTPTTQMTRVHTVKNDIHYLNHRQAICYSFYIIIGYH